MGMSLGPIAERVDWLFAHAARHAADYATPEATLTRQRYQARHPTAIAVLKCMDGRINIPVATGTPPGLIQPFRNLGGMFDLGWPHLGEVLAHYVHRQINEGRRVLLMATYHFSRGDPQRGCAGFNYDTGAALAATQTLRQQIEQVFGLGHRSVYPLICGFETDEDALILHGEHAGETLDLSTITPADQALLPARLAALCPDMPEQMGADLLPLLTGNLHHIAQIRQNARTLDTEHREWIICLGRGFDFLHMPNLALIVGPYSPQLADPIGKAARIIASNMQAGRIPDDGFLLLASSPYEEIGSDRARAEMKARFLSQFAAQVIAERVPSIAGRMISRTAVLDWRTRRLEQLAD
ncbi:MAG: carboxysome shell carbonic anhydrase [Dechloromonas sp.]|nr:carboxysome shell carbonic anhydrase [Dechloromonas sp.]